MRSTPFCCIEEKTKANIKLLIRTNKAGKKEKIFFKSHAF